MLVVVDWVSFPEHSQYLPAGFLFVSRIFASRVFLVRLPELELELSVTVGWRRREGGGRNFGEGVVPWRESEPPIGEQCVRTAQVQVQVQGGEGRKIVRRSLESQQAQEPLRMQTGCQVVGLMSLQQKVQAQCGFLNLGEGTSLTGPGWRDVPAFACACGRWPVCAACPWSAMGPCEAACQHGRRCRPSGGALLAIPQPAR